MQNGGKGGMHPGYEDHWIFYTKNKSLHPTLSLEQKDIFFPFFLLKEIISI